MTASTRRIPEEAGFCNPSALPRGPNGRALCRRCGTEVPKGKRSFCSPACVHEWKVRSQPSYAKREVAKRDDGVCAECRVDTVEDLRTSSFFKPTWGRSLSRWHMDHIVPVVEGGGSCGLDNLRTLCVACHRRVTAELRARLAERRRQQKARSA